MFEFFSPQVIVGSYLSVAGAFIGLLRRGRMSYFGLTLILWGIAREMFASGSTKAPSLSPEMILTMFVAFCSMKRDVRKIIKCCIAKRLKKRSKAKHG